MYDFHEIRAYVQRNFQFDGYDFYLFGWEWRALDAKYVADPVTFQEMPGDMPDSRNFQPAFMLREESAQRLMDGLWDAGVRPTHSQHVSEIIQAKDEHIKDQRSVIDRLLILWSQLVKNDENGQA